MAFSGIPTGESDQNNFGGAWTILKLTALRKYLSAYTRALSNQSFHLVYIDAFAGTGRCNVKTEGGTAIVDGSASIALQADPAFDHYCFVETAPQKIGALRSLADQYTDRSIDILRDDANSALCDLCHKFDWENTRAVLFLDPFGMNVNYATLKAVARTGAIDVWYLFSYSGFYRQLPKKAEGLDSNKAAAVTRIVGTDSWRTKFYDDSREPDMFFGKEEIRTATNTGMLEFFSERLRLLFPAVTDPKILYLSKRPGTPRGAPLFALYFAVSNPSPKARGLATKIARNIMDSL